jgi:uncharacterized repeat protein (TIGR01451 family)
MKLKTFALIAASSAMTLPAFAAGYDITATDTLFGTDISNTASLSYTSGSTTIEEDSNEVVFTVDRKVIFSVTDNVSNSIPATVNAGDTATTIYTLQNDSNAPISFELSVPDEGTTYSYTIGSVTTTISSTTATDSADLIIDLLKGDFTTPTNIEITVAVDVPDTASSGATIPTSLVLVAVEPATNPLIGSLGVTAGDPIIATADTVAWDEDVIQTISIGDLLNGASVELTSEQDYIVSASDISLVKSVAILSDPINGTTNPKAIPGAVVEYKLTITNSGLIAASDVVVVDAVPAVFDFSDDYEETYKLDDVAMSPSPIPSVDGTTLVSTLTFSAISVDAATDITDSSTYGKAVITFTVTLP